MLHEKGILRHHAIGFDVIVSYEYMVYEILKNKIKSGCRNIKLKVLAWPCKE